MTKIINDRPADFCLEKCPMMDLELDVVPFYSNDEIVQITNVLKCAHEPVCKMWSEYLKQTQPSIE